MEADGLAEYGSAVKRMYADPHHGFKVLEVCFFVGVLNSLVFRAGYHGSCQDVGIRNCEAASAVYYATSASRTFLGHLFIQYKSVYYFFLNTKIFLPCNFV